MVWLKNIEITDKTAKADFSPENTGVWGHLEVELSTQKVISIEHVPGYEMFYPGHTKQKLLEIAQTGDTATECLVMWY